MRIDVENQFATCVRKTDGVVIDDVLSGDPNAPLNADYWFPEHNVVAELKCLSEDLMKSSAFNKRASDLYRKWAKLGFVKNPVSSKIKFKLKDLPPKCARELVDPIKRRLEANTLRKANRQIKALRKNLNALHAKGLLILVNEGDYTYTPEMMCHLLARSLKAQYNSINSVIYFSVNEPVLVPGMSEPALFWANLLLPDREPAPSELLDHLQASWMSHYSGLFPHQVIPEFEIEPAHDMLQNIQFRKIQ